MIDHDAIAALDEKLASQIGDDIQVIFNHEYLFKEARRTIRNLYDEVKRLRAERDRLRAALESIAKNTCCEGCQEAALVARQALKGLTND